MAKEINSAALLQTALHIAARNGNPEMVKFLIEQGANLSATDKNGKTPLQVAAEIAAQHNNEGKHNEVANFLEKQQKTHEQNRPEWIKGILDKNRPTSHVHVGQHGQEPAEGIRTR